MAVARASGELAIAAAVDFEQKLREFKSFLERLYGTSE